MGKSASCGRSCLLTATLAGCGYLSCPRVVMPGRGELSCGNLTTWRAGISDRDAVGRDFSGGFGSDAPVPSCFCLAVLREAFEEEAITCRFATSRRSDSWSTNLDSTGTWWLSQPPPFVSPSDLPVGPTAQSLPLSAVVKNSMTPSPHPAPPPPLSQSSVVLVFWPVSSAIPRARANLCTAGRPEGNWFTAPACRATFTE